MKILHTGDLHIGRTLDGQSRIEEQAACLSEISQIIKEQKVDLLLIAGDIFDTFNPSAEAEGLYYDFLETATAGTACGIVIIAGNHDQPERLAAASPLAARHSIYILAQPNTSLATQNNQTNPYLTATGENWLELTWKKGEKAVIAALPYISEGRIGQLISEDLGDDSQSNLAYSLKIQELYKLAAAAFQEDAVNLAMGHLFAIGGKTSDSERSIQVGGSFGVRGDAFPAAAQYTALGHLHRKQQVKAAMPCYYSGSPLACGFAEADQTKYVMLVEAVAGASPTATKITEIPLTSGYPLHQEEFADYEEAEAWCQQVANQQNWLNIKIQSPSPLTEAQIKTLRGSHPRLLRLEVILPESTLNQTPALETMSLAQRFQLFVANKTQVDAGEELTELFLKLTEDDPSLLNPSLNPTLNPNLEQKQKGGEANAAN